MAGSKRTGARRPGRPPGAARGAPRVNGFPPIAGRDAEILILGSMPGAVSLRAGEYYANRQNAFWRIMTELLRLEDGLAYRRRTGALKTAGIALWDVLASCERAGSGDAAIDARTLVVNDFAAFFRRHPRVRRVYFNGAAAEALYRRHVLPVLAPQTVAYRRLPSTSPAHAALPYARKLAAWRAVARASKAARARHTPRSPAQSRHSHGRLDAKMAE